MANVSVTPADVVGFWRDAGPDKWFEKDSAFDTEIRTRFLSAHEAAAAGALADWEASAQGALALLILLDQFPRNMFRGTARMYVSDPQALALAKRAIAAGYDNEVEAQFRGFFYLPLSHSENLADQEQAVALYQKAGDENVSYALEHADVIRRFGRFPHRNPLLGRQTTAEEQAFLDAGGFAG
ncbi:MAG TPA: DUF924 family protein [Pseudolabrys sp.]|nr:DUF924 family protein [Pseudolabrys sp.]